MIYLELGNKNHWHSAPCWPGTEFDTLTLTPKMVGEIILKKTIEMHYWNIIFPRITNVMSLN